MPNIDLLITFCTHRGLTAPTGHSLELLRLAGGLRYTVVFFSGDALITRSRSQACSKFLKDTDIPYMLFIDDDIQFTPDDVIKIYNHLKNGYDVVGGIYPVRGASQLSSYGWNGVLQVDEKLQEIEYLATGFMGISRRCLEKVRDDLKLPWLNPNDWSQCWPFFEAGRKEDRPHGDPIYISEDWDFSEKARKVGYKIYADTSVKLGHMREQMFTPEDVRNLQQKQSVDKQIYGAMVKQQELMRSVDTDLSEFLHQSIPFVQEKIKTAQKELAEAWNTHKGTAEKFYLDNTTYLYDLAWFNQQPHFWQDRVGQLVNIRGTKSLDIGCGIGTLVFMLGEENDATGWDINKRCIDFAEFKKKKYDLKGNFTIEKPDYSQFDLITAVDVLEHIANLEEFLMDLGKGMKRGAKFYHSDYFEKGESWPMHFEQHSKHVSTWLTNAGLIEWDNRWTIKGG